MAQIFQTEKVAGNAVVIRVLPGVATRELISRLEVFFDECLSNGTVYVTIDLKEVSYPTTTLIAMLISFCVRTRQRNGDLVLENLSKTAKSNLLTFSAYNYLQQVASAMPPAQDYSSAATEVSPEEHRPPAYQPEVVEPVVSQQGRHNLAPSNESFAPNVSSMQEDLGSEVHTKRVTSEVKFLYSLCDFVVHHGRLAGLDDKEIGKIRITIYEACLNVIEHAYHSHADKWIDLSVQYNTKKMVIIIKDYGLSFKMKPNAEYDVNRAVDERRKGGFGMHIIRRSVDHVEYRPDKVNGNMLILIKHLT